MNPLLRRDHSPLGPDFAAMVPDMQRIYLEHGVTHLPGRRHRADMAKVLVGLAAPACEDGHRELSHVGQRRVATLADNAESTARATPGTSASAA